MRLIFTTLFFFVNLAYADDDDIRMIDPIQLEAEVIDVEKPYSFIIKADPSDDMLAALTANEIRRKNFALKTIDDKKRLILKVVIKGISRESNRGVIRALYIGKKITLLCDSIMLESYSGRLPSCNALFDGKDLVLHALESTDNKSGVEISTWAIHSLDKASAYYKKTRINLLLKSF